MAQVRHGHLVVVVVVSGPSSCRDAIEVDANLRLSQKLAVDVVSTRYEG